MKFLLNRKRRKLAADLKARRHAEDDLLSPALRSEFDTIIRDLENAPATSESIKTAQERAGRLKLPEKRGGMWAFLDLILVVGAVAFGLRGLYFQPFRIPTGSMQPTLFGIHYQVREGGSNSYLGKLPLFLNNLLFGTTEAVLNSPASGNAGIYYRNEPGLIFDSTRFEIGGKAVTLPGTPEQVRGYAGLNDPEKTFQEGEKVADGFVALGDHLFVERFSLYLNPPKRGDVMVFTTEGLRYNGRDLKENSGYYYIKRIAALPGDVIKLDNHQLWIKPQGKGEFRRIQEVEKRFGKIYSGKGGYHGHVSDMGSQPFTNGGEYTVPRGKYIMLGDNSKFSLDSRFFGAVDRRQLIGRAWLTFYPLSRRIGPVDSKAPLDVPSGNENGNTFPAMYRQ